MFKIILGILSLLMIHNCYAATSDIPCSIRLSYALKFHEAFIIQSYGWSTMSFNKFCEAYREALAAGESMQKITFIEDLWKWYRIHGDAMGLFARTPTGGDRFPWTRTTYEIDSSPQFYLADYYLTDTNEIALIANHLPSRSPLAEIPHYQSEFGKTPEQAKNIREFLFGTGQVIGGIFCIIVGGPITKGIGLGLVANGGSMMFVSLNQAYADYERAKLDMETLQSRAKKVAELP